MMAPESDGKRNGDTSEFTSFLEDVAQEISERVQSLTPAARRTPITPVPSGDERRIFDWPKVTDRMIDELR